jgi:hypothetical protein
MSHGTDSQMGAIDDGDYILIKDEGYNTKPGYGVRGITTWVEKKEEHYSTWGDVLLYEKDGSGGMPVLHRAIVWLEVNYDHYNSDTNDGATYDIPSMGLQAQIGVITIEDYPAFGRNGDSTVDLLIDLNDLLMRAKLQGKKPMSGYITKGDWNHNMVDQFSLRSLDSQALGLITPQQITGTAFGEIPQPGLVCCGAIFLAFGWHVLLICLVVFFAIRLHRCKKAENPALPY